MLATSLGGSTSNKVDLRADVDACAFGRARTGLPSGSPCQQGLLGRIGVRATDTDWCEAAEIVPALLESQHEEESIVDRSQFVVAEVGDLMAEIASVDRTDHFAEHAGEFVVKVDLRVKACGRRARRGWADDHG
jgi:hypothetical protein